MQRILDVRIVAWYFKLLYIVVVWFAPLPFTFVVNAVGAAPIFSGLLSTTITLAGVLLGARVFRGRREPLAPRRPWWKMTAHRRASAAIGSLATIGVIVCLLGIAPAVGEGWLSIFDIVTTATLFAALAFFYLNSAVRLGPTPARIREPKFKNRVSVR